MSIATMLTGAAGRARTGLDPLVRGAAGDLASTRALINGTRGDVIKALGQPRASAFLAELHASSANLLRSAEPMDGVVGILGAMHELEQAAAKTAMKRIVGGAVVGTGLLVGAAALAGRGDESQPMAPGPIGETPAGGGGAGGSWV